MPRTVETTVYQFDELSDKAKEKARDWYREVSAGDNYFAESVIEDAATIADLFGLNFRQVPIKLMNGKTRTEPAVNWSGFSSQGDGASFEGTYRYAPDALAKVKAYAPTDETLHAIVAELDQLQAKYDNALESTITCGNSRYSHSNTMQFTCTAERDDMPSIEEAEENLPAILRRFADWIYRQLESAYEDANSGDQVDDTIRANEYEFTGDGKRA